MEETEEVKEVTTDHSVSYGVTVYGVQCKVPGVTMSGVSFVDTVKHFMNQCVHIQHLNVIEYYVQVLHAFREDE